MFDMKKMMEQAQQVQFRLQELQEKFKEIIVEGTSGGGLVTVQMSCAGVVKSLNIDPSLLAPEEKETAEDLVIAALNNASEAKEARVQEETQTLMQASGIDPNAAGGGMPF